jgi:hypothetical protein
VRHEQVREDLPLYAAGGLDGPAAEAVERHLATCDVCRADLRALEDDLALFLRGSVSADWQGHRRLRQDFERRLSEAAQTASADGPVPGPARPVLRRQGRVAERARSASRTALWPVVWAATLIVAGAGWSLALARHPQPQNLGTIAALVADGRRVRLAPDHAAGARVTLYVGSRRALVAVKELPRLARGQVYEGWWIVGGRPLPAGTFASGLALLPLRPGATEFAITVEPAPGSREPSTPILAAASL